MSNLTQLRLAAREIFAEALPAVDPGEAVRRVSKRQNNETRIAGTAVDLSKHGVYSIAMGKAAPAMAIALEECLRPKLIRGIVAGPKRSQDSKAAQAGPTWQYFESGHPVPNEASMLAARA